MLIVLRHARAGPKLADAVRDFERPLDATGRAAAIALPDVLLDCCTPSTIVSSPFLRCTQTVAPLARRLGLNVEERHELTPATSALACAASSAVRARPRHRLHPRRAHQAPLRVGV